MIIQDKLSQAPVALVHLNSHNFSKNYCDWLNDADLVQFTELRFKKYKENDILAFINQCNISHSCLLLGIFYQHKHVGNIKADLNLHHRTASMGIMIGERDLHRKGIASSAITLLADYLMTHLNIFKVNAGAYHSHIASINAFQKVGFETEYIKKSHVINAHGVREDVIVMVKYARE